MMGGNGPRDQQDALGSRGFSTTARRRPRIRVVLPMQVSIRQEQQTQKPASGVKMNAPDDLKDPQRSPIQTPVPPKQQTLETQRNKMSPPDKAEDPPQTSTRQKQGMPIPEAAVKMTSSAEPEDPPQTSNGLKQGMPIPEAQAKMVSADELKDPPLSTLQTPVVPQQTVVGTQLNKMDPPDRAEDLPQTSIRLEPGMSMPEVVVKTVSSDEVKEPQPSSIQVTTPHEKGVPEDQVDTKCSVEPKKALRLSEYPDCSDSLNAANLSAVPSSLCKDPIVKHTFYPPMVLKPKPLVNPIEKSSPATGSSAGIPKVVSEDITDTSTTTANEQFQEPRVEVTTTSSRGSAVDRMKRYKEQKAQSIKQIMIEREQKLKKQMASLHPVPQFIPGKIPDSIQEQKKALPIYKVKDQLIDAIKNYQFVIVTGETGSGKSTQLPQYIAEARLHGEGRIAITQPRRVAAKSVATRVAMECGVALGTTVGYKIRFDRSFGNNTVIKFVTDGVLVNECINEDTLAGYSVVIIDEAHERSIKTDVCLGLLRKAARKRPDLKIIVSSATLEKQKFLKYFENAVVFEITGKPHPIDIVYKPDQDYLCGAVETVLEINRSKGQGDILVFLAFHDEIELVTELIETKLEKEGSSVPKLIITPCYSALPFEDQQKIFEPTPESHRKVVLATNIAETSLTIDGIRYVIDSGFFKQTEYNPKSDIYSLVRKQITKSQAIQRCGRAGRTQPGICYRLYSQEFYERTMETATKPEITRLNMESLVLDIMAMGIADPLDFGFIDPPSEEGICEALLHLNELSAVEIDEGRKFLKLTPTGRDMSKFPITPRLAKVVLESELLGCTDEVVKIVAMLNTQYQNIFKLEAGKTNREKLEIAKERLKKKTNFYGHPDGDMLTFLQIYDGWALEGYSKDWCTNNFIQYRILNEAREIRRELLNIMRNCGFGFQANEKATFVDPTDFDKKSESIRKAFTSGFFRQVAKKNKWDPGHGYLTLGNPGYVEEVYVHPFSSLHSTNYPLLIYHDVLTTTKSFIQGVIKVESRWFNEFAPEFVFASDYRT